jgi:hypothetical protein
MGDGGIVRIRASPSARKRLFVAPKQSAQANKARRLEPPVLQDDALLTDRPCGTCPLAQLEPGAASEADSNVTGEDDSEGLVGGHSKMETKSPVGEDHRTADDGESQEAEAEPNQASDLLAPGEEVNRDTPMLDDTLVGSDIIFCFESPTGWQRGTVSKDVTKQKHQFNFIVTWEDDDVQKILLRADQYTYAGHKAASWCTLR